MNDIYFSSLLSVCISPELDICNCFVPNSSNVRFRWKADVQDYSSSGFLVTRVHRPEKLLPRAQPCSKR